MQLSMWPRHAMSITRNPKVRKYSIMIHKYLFMCSTFYEVDLIVPAVQGTLGILKSALKNGYVSIAP